MKTASTIATIAVVQVSTMLASAIVLIAVGEGLNWFLMWNDARKDR